MNENRLANERGQSLVLVAVAMVALVIFVAITVDVSSAYYARRTAQNAADGAALAGVSRMATGINKKNARLDDDIKADMNDFAERNGIEDTEGDLADDLNDNVDGWYVDAAGDRLAGEPMVGDQYLDYIPDGAAGIEAISYITAPTYFGGIFGIDGYPLQARAVALLREACGSDCLVPIVASDELLLDQFGEPRLDECFHIWKERLINKDASISQGLLGWVNWTWQQSVCSGAYDCEEPRPCPYLDQDNGCSEEILEGNIDPSLGCASGFVKVGDWVAAAPGDMNSTDIRCALSYFVGYDDPNDSSDDGCSDGMPHSFTIPVYDGTTADEGIPSASCGPMPDPCNIYDINPKYALHYHIAGLARMQVIQFQLSQGQVYPPDSALTEEELARVNSCKDYYDFVVVPGTETPEPNLTPTPVPSPTPSPPEGFRITVEFLEYVQDFSSSDECYDPWGTLLSSPRLTE